MSRSTAELFLPAVAADELDSRAGRGGGDRACRRTATGRATCGSSSAGCATAAAWCRPAGRGLDADIRFALSGHPPEGGFCRHCGAELQVDVVSVITPPDGGIIGTPKTHCGACGAE